MSLRQVNRSEHSLETGWAYYDPEIGFMQCAEDIASFNLSKDNFCPMVSDEVSCWPPTRIGKIAVIPCFAEFNTIKYNTTANATRRCLANGTWETNSNYSSCKPIIVEHEILKDEWDVTESATIVYYVGYSISLVALIIALTIFFYFKDLRCLRNTFHANLMLTYILVDLMWIITASSNTTLEGMCAMVILLYYFKGTNFFWMFVEGFYLYLLVVRTFTVDQVKIPVYMIIGWGTPAVVVTVWAAVKTQLRESHNHLEENHLNSKAPIGCPWLKKHDYDWIFIAPILIVLFVNALFLMNIMWVLITKLRAATLTMETQQYRKAAKALLVLIPLLGVTYLLVIAAPKEGFTSVIFAYLRSVLISTQGFTVSILYCFLNGEVRNTVRHHWQRWREERSIGCHTRHSFQCCSETSYKSQTESIPLNTRISGKNDNCRSYVTSNSYVGNEGTTVVIQDSPTSLGQFQDAL